MAEPRTRQSPVDEGYSWVILIASCLMYMLVIGSIKSFGILYTEFLEYFDRGAGNTAWVGSGAIFLLLALGPVANVLSVTFSFRSVTFVGGVLIGIGYFITAFVPNLEYMYLTLSVVAGLGYGMAFTPCATVISYYFDKHRALANGIVVSGSGIGAFGLPYLYRFLIDEYGLKGSFMIIGAILSHICVAAGFLRQHTRTMTRTIKEDREPRTKLASNGKENELSTIETFSSDKAMLNTNSVKDLRIKKKTRACENWPRYDWSVFKVPSFIMYCVAFTLCLCGYTSNFTMLPAQIDALGLGKQKAVIALSILGITEVFARIFFGWFADRKFFPVRYLFVMSMAVSGLACMLIPFSKSFPAWGVYGAIVGIFPGSFWSLIAIIMIETVGIERLATAMGLCSFCMAFGAAIGQPIVGWLEDATGSWDLSFRVVGIIKLLAGAIVLAEPLLKYVSRSHVEEKGEQIVVDAEKAPFIAKSNDTRLESGANTLLIMRNDDGGYVVQNAMRTESGNPPIINESDL